MHFLQWYLIVANAIAFLLAGIDKARAVRCVWRIPERVLFASCFLGGTAGFYLGMLLFRHKVRKRRFALGVPLLLFGQALFAALFLCFLNHFYGVHL